MMDLTQSSSGHKGNVLGKAAISFFPVEVYDAQNMDVFFCVLTTLFLL
jgi:hypothetical protein